MKTISLYSLLSLSILVGFNDALAQTNPVNEIKEVVSKINNFLDANSNLSMGEIIKNLDKEAGLPKKMAYSEAEYLGITKSNPAYRFFFLANGSKKKKYVFNSINVVKYNIFKNVLEKSGSQNWNPAYYGFSSIKDIGDDFYENGKTENTFEFKRAKSGALGRSIFNTFAISTAVMSFTFWPIAFTDSVILGHGGINPLIAYGSLIFSYLVAPVLLRKGVKRGYLNNVKTGFSSDLLSKYWRNGREIPWLTKMIQKLNSAKFNTLTSWNDNQYIFRLNNKNIGFKVSFIEDKFFINLNYMNNEVSFNELKADADKFSDAIKEAMRFNCEKNFI